MTTDKHEELERVMRDFLNSEIDGGGTITVLERLCHDLLAENARLKAAMEWQPMRDAPIDGTVIRVKLGEMTFLVSWQDGFMNEDEEACSCWVATEENHHPECWSGGVCYDSNEHGDTSEYPEAWQLPTPPKEQTR